MKYSSVITFTVLIFSMFSFNCATIIKGYEDTVILKNAPDSLRVVTQDGIELNLGKKVDLKFPPKGGTAMLEVITKTLSLRSNKEHTLHLLYKDKEKIVKVYPKVKIGWALLDIICLGVPVIFDMYTGNWNAFPDIDAVF